MRRKQLGAELRRLREAAKISPGRAAMELDCSEARIRHLENGRNTPTKPDLTVLATLYGIPADIHEQLERARQEAGERGWWANYRLPNPLQNYVGMEADATLTRNWELELVPGLLQTEAYARAVHQLTSHLVPPAQIDLWVAARMKRQERLRGDQPLRLHAVVSEGALRRLNGSELAVEQFRHMVAAADLPNVTLQVLPFSAGMHPSMAGGFTHLAFPEDVSEPVGWLEYAIGGQMVDDRRSVASLGLLFDQLAERALSPRDSVRYINEFM